MNVDPVLDALRTHRAGGVGIDAWSLYVAEERRLSVGTRDGITGGVHTPLRVAESIGARYLIVWEDGKISRGPLERRQITEDVCDALELARAAAYDDPDAAQVLGPAEFPDVELYDDRVTDWIDGELTLLGERLARVRDRLRAGSFRTWSGSTSAVEGRGRVVSSRGLDVHSRGTSTGWYVSFEGEWGDGHSARALETEAEFNRRLDRLGATVQWLKQPVPAMAAGVHPVILHPHVVDSLVMGTLLHNLDGSSVAHGDGFFKRDDFESGRALLRDDLSLVLDPLVPLRSGSYRFTVEGVPATRCTLIENGVLRTPILDLKYANRLGMEPTPIPYGGDALQLATATDVTADEAFALAAGGALVLSVLGVHTQDPASGDFSLSAPQVLKLGDDGPEGRIRATISGNLFEVLRSDTLTVVRFEGETTPGLLFPCRLDPSP
jgi:PmbA protein